ncbi:hypothetical protein GQ54DRAFT_194115 [Martensiomyces pterosporus]|nr:hypothetical protein GQ54DRAFT_194115 [Martensiomyces pterosporus]
MSDTEDSTPSQLLLRLSACADAHTLAEALSTCSLDPVTLVSVVPECVDANGLVGLLHALEDMPKPSGEVGQKGASEWLATEQWSNACVQRAEAIDRWTGRLDRAVQWLEAASSLTPAENTREIGRVLRNATLLDRILIASDDQASDLLRPLSEVDAMTADEYVSWLMQLVTEWPGLVSVLDVVCEQMHEDVRAAWNVWWAQNLVIAGPAGVMPAIVDKHTDCFDPYVVLAAVYSIGGGCSELHGARAAVSVLAKALGVSKASDSAEFPPAIHKQLEDPSAHVLLENIQGFSVEDLATAVGAALAQIECLAVLSAFELNVDMPTIVACQDSVEDQYRLLLKLLASAHRSSSPSPSLWEALLQLHDARLFTRYTADEIKQEYLRSLLGSEKFGEARSLIDMAPAFDDDSAVVRIVCEVARELFDNADSGNMDKGLVRAASACLDVLPKHLADGDDGVRKERALIDAAHLAWTLQAPSLSMLSSRSAASPSGEVLPIEVRLASDPYTLVKMVLERCVAGYKKPRVVREISGKLLDSTGPSSPAAGRRGLGVNSVSDSFVAALLLDSATSRSDYAAAYEFARQLITARPVLNKALRAAEEYRSSHLLADNSSETERPVDVRAIEQVWGACMRLATAWSGAGSAGGVGEKRLEVISLALGLCPTSKISELLRLWNSVQAGALDNSAECEQPPWMASGGQSRLPCSVQEALAGHAGICGAEQAKEHAETGEAVDLETMRTFDPAIIKRGLRLAASKESNSDLGSGLRCDLLMEWLDFSLTTAKEPTTERGLGFRRKVEADIVDKYAEPACNVLAQRVFPQLDQTNYLSLELFYSFYARCLDGCKSPSAEQAQVRAQITRYIQQSSSPLDSADCSSLLAAFMAPKSETRTALQGAVNQTTVTDLAGLAPLLVKLHPIAQIDSVSTGADGEAADRWADADALASRLCLWVLQDTLDRGVGHLANTGGLASQFGTLLAGYLPTLQADDLASLATRLAFDADTARALDLNSRWEAVRLCANKAHESSDAAEAGLREASASKAYVDYIVALHSIRDPFTFAKMPSEWAQEFDTAYGSFVLSSKDSDAVVSEKCTEVLVDMVVSEVPAYFVCQVFMHTKALSEQWGGRDVVPSLADIYTRALDRVAMLATSAVDQDEAARRVVAVVEPPLELCSFDYGDDALGAALSQFKHEFRAVVADTVHGRRERLLDAQEYDADSVALSSTAKLALLEVLNKYYSSLHTVASEAANINAAAGAPSGRDGDTALGGISESDYLQFRLLVDKHWGVQVPDDGGRRIGDRCETWSQLLEVTDPQSDAADEQIDTLVLLLAQWSSESLEGVSKCWSSLLEWAVRNKRPERVVSALVKNPEQFTTDIGARVFEALLLEVQDDPTMAAPLAALGLSYPDRTWAERCMEPIIYVMLAAPTDDAIGESEGAEAANVEEDVPALADDADDDPWGIEDVPLDDDQAAEKVPDADDTDADAGSVPTPEQLAMARRAILDSTLLHLAIMIRGFVSACLASPPLLEALGATLLHSQDKVQREECQDLLRSQIPAPQIQGVLPIHELFRRTVHTVAEVGMEDVALRWIYAFLDVPGLYRCMASKRMVEQWFEHLDRVLLGNEAVERSKAAALSSVSQGSADSADAGPALSVENSDELVAGSDGPGAADDDGSAGWGESDVDIDLDSDLDDDAAVEASSHAARPKESEEQGTPPDSAASAGKEPASSGGAKTLAAAAAPQAPMDGVAKTGADNLGEAKDEAGGWGDDDDDIDLDADLENL